MIVDFTEQTPEENRHWQIWDLETGKPLPEEFIVYADDETGLIRSLIPDKERGFKLNENLTEFVYAERYQRIRLERLEAPRCRTTAE